MSVRGAGSIPKIKFAAPKSPKLPKQAVIKGPGVPRMKAPGVVKIPTLPSLEVQARRGLTPRVELAKAAGSGSGRTRRNPNYPTP